MIFTGKHGTSAAVSDMVLWIIDNSGIYTDALRHRV